MLWPWNAVAISLFIFPFKVVVTFIFTSRIFSRGDPKKPRSDVLKKSIYSYMFKLQSPSKYFSSDAIYLLRHFPLLKTVFELVNFDGF